MGFRKLTLGRITLSKDKELPCPNYLYQAGLPGEMRFCSIRQREEGGVASAKWPGGSAYANAFGGGALRQAWVNSSVREGISGLRGAGQSSRTLHTLSGAWIFTTGAMGNIQSREKNGGGHQIKRVLSTF